MTDLLALTASLVAIPSVSRNEGPITDHIEGLLRPVSWLDTVRVGNNLIARTSGGRHRRVVLAGHTDTVPPNGNEQAVVEGDVLWGIGSADMKAGDAILLDLATTVSEPSVDVTYVFYECEELGGSELNGLAKLFRDSPELLAGDAAILAEPTGGRVEGGCQGIITFDVEMEGLASHAARGWMGRNAIHRLGDPLIRLSEYEPRRVTIDGCEYIESMQAVNVSGGIAHNVVPDRARLTVNHRFAPDRDFDAAEQQVRSVIGEVDSMVRIDTLPAAAPALGHPVLQALLGLSGGPARAKLGWTDVARFASRGFPATNFGPGEPKLAHTIEERVTRQELDQAHEVLFRLITGAVA